MKPILSFFIALSITMMSSAQMLKKYPIGESGCAYYGYCSIPFEKILSEDSSELTVGECVNDGVTYGVICVKLLSPATNLDDAETMVVDYMDFLKKNFDITKAVGYGRGNHLGDHEDTRGVTDYWEDKDKNNWKIKAWTDGKIIGVLYGYSAKELNETKLNVFLDSFRFPGM